MYAILRINVDLQIFHNLCINVIFYRILIYFIYYISNEVFEVLELINNRKIKVLNGNKAISTFIKYFENYNLPIKCNYATIFYFLYF